MADTGTINASIVQTPVVAGIDNISVTCIKNGTSTNEMYDLDYDTLSASDKQKVDDFIQLVIDQAP